MKPIFCLSLLLASCAWADEATDRAGVLQTMSRLSAGDPQPRLFTSDFEDSAEYAHEAVFGRVVISKAPWGEATIVLPPSGSSARFVIRSIRFVTAEVALVDAIDRQYDRGLVLLVLKKEGIDWRLASFKRVAEQVKTAP